MAITPMTLVTVNGALDSLDRTIHACMNFGEFHPEPATLNPENPDGYVPLSEENPFLPLLNQIKNAAALAGITLHGPPDAEPESAEPWTATNIAEAEEYLAGLYDELRSLLDKKEQLAGEVLNGRGALQQLCHIKGMDIPFEELFSCRYIKIRFGTIPAENYHKLIFYNTKPFIFVSFDNDNYSHWGVYFTTDEFAPEIDNIFSSLYFERIRIPDNIRGTPEHAEIMVREELEAVGDELAMVEARLLELSDSNCERLTALFRRVTLLSEMFGFRRYVATMGDQYHIVGFIPTDKCNPFTELMQDLARDGGKIEFQLLPHDSDKRLTTPTRLKNNRFAKPFEMFVEMYGTPGYDDIDPTPYVAVTYTLLFGIMFGDLGQGLVIFLIGLVLWRWKKSQFGRILERIGLSSAAFGLVYGSVFGMEEVLTPLYKSVFRLADKPIHVMAPATTTVLLGASIGLGAVLILVSMSVNIVLGFRRRDFGRAVFGHNGIAGFVFYSALLVGAAVQLLFGIRVLTAPYILILILLPLLVIFFKEPLAHLTQKIRHAEPGDGILSFIIESFFEVFEVVLSFITNTMSFLRVGGFVLSHAGMMTVVLTLSNMVGSGASLPVMIIGNLFVMGLEGLIVGIQALRLEFYEIFSRFFDGEGKPFVPISAEVSDPALSAREA